MSQPKFQPLGCTANFYNRLSNSNSSSNAYHNLHPSLERTRSNAHLSKISFKPTKQFPSVSNRMKQFQTEALVNYGAMIEDGEVIPHDMVLLLTEEARNIKNFKAKIEKEKAKVVADIEVFKKEINHIIDDLKLSMVAQLDSVYKSYIEKYAILKTEIMEIRRIKKQIHSQNTAPSEISKLITSQRQASNLDIVRDIQEEMLSMRTYKITSFVNNLQKKKITPLTDVSKDLVLLTSSSVDFYDSNRTTTQLAQLKQNFSHFTSHMFTALGQFVRTPQILSDLVKGTSQPLLKGIQISKISERHQKLQRPVTSWMGNTAVLHPLSPKKTARREFSISQSQQILCTGWAEDINLKHVNSIQPGHFDLVLCAIVINNKYLVTGGKDSQLIVTTLQGEKIASLRGHESSICTLALIEDKGVIYLASGSDHGCNSIIIWDTSSWSIKAKIKAHTAAVTSIVDLCDGQTLVSGSYDKKINVYNYKRSALLFSLPNNKSSVTSMLLNSSRNKLISCGFDSMMFVWNISRDQTGVVEAISIDRVIQNNSIICCLSGSMLRPQTIVAGTKDGKIKFWNINTGEVEKTLTVNSNLIIDMALIQRESKPNFPIILSCSCKDRSLVLTRTDSGTNSVLEVGGRNFIQFGCGISPKMIFVRYDSTPMMAMVSQNPQSKEVNMFQLELK